MVQRRERKERKRREKDGRTLGEEYCGQGTLPSKSRILRNYEIMATSQIRISSNTNEMRKLVYWNFYFRNDK